MPLREVGEFHAWVAREDPSIVAQRAVRTFLVEISDTPWRWPSVPISELSNQPEYEVRSASLIVPGEQDVEVWYLHDYATGAVDVIAVTAH